MNKINSFLWFLAKRKFHPGLCCLISQDSNCQDWCGYWRQNCKFIVGANNVHIRSSPRLKIGQFIQYILNWPLPIGAFQGQWKQSTKQQNTTTTTVKNPNWPEANQLAIYKCSWEVEPGTTRNKFTEWSERVLNPGSPDLKASALTTGPHCLPKETIFVTWSPVIDVSDRAL